MMKCKNKGELNSTSSVPRGRSPCRVRTESKVSMASSGPREEEGRWMRLTTPRLTDRSPFSS
jgi:hypothetical protein